MVPAVESNVNVICYFFVLILIIIEFLYFIMEKITFCKSWSFLKTFTRNHSSKEWLLRQKTDPYVEKAKIKSYRYCK